MIGDQTNEFSTKDWILRNFYFLHSFRYHYNSLNFTAKIRVLILKNRTNVMFIITQTEDTLLR